MQSELPCQYQTHYYLLMATRFKLGKDHDWLDGCSDEEKKMIQEMYEEQQQDKKRREENNG